MRIYMAGGYSSMQLLRADAEKLRRLGKDIVVDCTWLTGAYDDTAPIECASGDISDIMKSDLVLLYTKTPSTKGGMYVEMGYAMAIGCCVIIVGPYTNIFTRRFRRVDSIDEILTER
jgi:hypothetical protein